MRKRGVQRPGQLLLGGVLLAAAVQAQPLAAPDRQPALPLITPPIIGLGQPLPQAHIDRFSITIFPDGRNLPPGQGSVAQGARLYQAQCAACHGDTGIEGPAARLAGSDGFFGWSDPLRVLRIRSNPLLVVSVGARWPYATTLFDYVRRAMPHHAPKSLTDDAVYALTAHLLHLNGLVPSTAVMNREALPRVSMPGLAKTVSAWPTQP
ncbi:MAG: cytochrome c [Rhodoferax sp.]|nr:cytochrome c [Rhodoferax sp.]MDP3651775.1 cytochrome c [Rhodoferax sp.]